MSNFTNFLKNVGSTRLAIIASLIIGLFTFIIFLNSRIAGTGGMSLLYAGLEPADSAKIVAQLESEDIPYELQGNGTQILVPKNDVMRLRLSIAEQGLTGDSGVGYEIFDDSDALGATNFVQNVNRLRALEGELSRTIRSIDMIENARVHIVIPQRQLFERSEQEPSATVVVKIHRRGTLSPGEVRAIRNLVATSVPGLSLSRITIVDSTGALLARGSDESEDGILDPSDAAEARRNYEIKTARMIESLLERTIGLGKVKAEVNVDMDFDRIVTNSESYDPDGQVVRSTQTVEEEEASQETAGDPPVTVEENLPDAEAAPLGGDLVSNTTSSRVEETVNYEISRTTSNHVRESGILNRLSVAVLVDGVYTQSDTGEQIYQPRSPEELERLAALVRSAVGYDESRGDVVEVVNMPFVSLEDELSDIPADSLFSLYRQDYIRIAEILILGVISILVILLIVRPLVMRVLEATPKTDRELLAGEPDYLTDQSATMAAQLSAQPGTGERAEDSDMDEESDDFINLNQIEGQLKASTVKQISEIIDKYPDETLQTIRGWIYQN